MIVTYSVPTNNVLNNVITVTFCFKVNIVCLGIIIHSIIHSPYRPQEYIFECMDCPENPLTWDQERKCTYYYKILDGNLEGVYVQQSLDISQLYKVNNNFKTEICEGCDSFCSNEQECNEYENIDDFDPHIGVICLERYYFVDDNCEQCLENCATCFDAQNCAVCVKGFFLDGNSCLPCPENCLSCSYDTSIICIECRLPSVLTEDLTQCITCNESCARCDNFNSRCRQCSQSNYVIHSSGTKCVKCEIKNCEQCYQNLQDGFTTINLDFPPTLDESPQLCQLCNKNFQLSPDKSECITKVGSENCEYFDENGDCQKCGQGYIFNTQTLTCSNSCKQKIENCLNCFQYLEPDAQIIYDSLGNPTNQRQLSYQCLECAPNYYPDFFNGKCEPCPNYCTQCWQYSPSYNYTSLAMQLVIISQSNKILNEPLNELMCTKCLNGFKLYQNECLGCLSDCSIDGVDQCTYDQSIAYCSKCAFPTIQQSLESDLTQCQECPFNCAACRDRTQHELMNINPIFDPIYPTFDKYSKLCYKPIRNPQPNTYLFMMNNLLLNTCNSNKLCTYSSALTVKLYCDDDLYDQEILTATDEDQAIMLKLSDIFLSKQKNSQLKFKGIELYKYYEELNKYSVTLMTLTVEIKGQVCSFLKPTYFESYFQQNVFSLSQFNLIFTSEIKTKFQQIGQLYFSNINSIQFNNIDFLYNAEDADLKSPKIFGINISGMMTSVSIKDSIIEKSINTFLINLLNCKSITFDNVKLIKVDRIFVVTPYVNAFQLTLNKVTIDQCNLANGFLFDLNPANNNTIIANKIQIINSQFVNSSVFRNYNNPVSIQLNEIQILFTKFKNSTFLSSGSITSSLIQQLDIITCVFNKSYLIRLNQLQINKLYVHQTVLSDDSYLLSTITEQQHIFESKLSNIIFSESDCNNINCLILMVTPKMNIVIENLQILNTINNIDDQLVQFIDSALVSIQNMNQIQINKMRSFNNQGITVLFISQIKSIKITTLDCDSSINSNLIPSSSDCTENILSTLNYNSYCLYIRRFTHGVLLQDILIREQLYVDASSIVIESYDVLQHNTTQSLANNELEFYQNQTEELIIILDLVATNNSLVSYELGSQQSLIMIISEQQQKVQISNVSFQSTHLHKSSNYQTEICTSNLLILSHFGQITISDAQFYYNRATKQNYGLVYISSHAIEISRSYFMFTNILEDVWVNRIAENQLSSENNIKSFFQIVSYGSNLFLNSKYITIKQCMFNNSFGLNGNSIYALLKTPGHISITQSTFLNQRAAITSQTEGGSIFIDATQSQMQFSFTFSKMQSCQSRDSGGCIYVTTSTQTQSVLISNSEFSECQSLFASFMDIQFPTKSQVTPIVHLQSLIVQDNNYLGLLSRMNEIDIQSTVSTVYYQNNGNLDIMNCKFSNIKYSGILTLLDINILTFNQVEFTSNLIYAIPLVKISTLQQIMIGDVKFKNNTEYTHTIIDNCALQQNINYILPEQLCELTLEYVDESYSLTFDDELYDENIYDSYINNFDRYTYKQRNLNVIQSGMGYNFNFLQSLNNPFCVLQLIWEQYDILFADLSYFLILSLSDSNTIKAQYFNMENNKCNNCYGGLLQIRNIESKNDQIEFNELNCIDNQIGYYGCVTMTPNSYVEDIPIYQTLYGNSRLLAYNSEIEYSVLINNSQCSNNTAKVGTCFGIIQLTTLINNSNFVNNYASYVGGAIYFTNENSDKMIYIYQSIFLSNMAQIAGALYLDNATIANTEYQSNHYLNNVGSLGVSNILEITYKLSIKINNNSILTTKPLIPQGNEIRDIIVINSNTIINLNNSNFYLYLPSGQIITDYKYYYPQTMEQVPFNWIFRLINLNQLNEEIINLINGDSCTIKGRLQNITNYDNSIEYSEQFTNIKQTFYNQQKGGYDLDELIIILDPYIEESIYLELIFQCQSIKIPILNENPPYQIVDYNPDYALLVRIKTFPCQFGEAYQNKQCIQCKYSENQYNVVPKNPTCKSIDETMMKAVTPVSINLKQNWWRPYVDNDQIAYCTNYPKNCKGGWVAGNPSCIQGHIGALCESCDIYSKFNDISYATSEKYICTTCVASKNDNIGVLVGTTFATVASITLSVKGTYDLVQSFLILKVLVIMGARIKSNTNNLATQIKMLTNYFQIIQILFTFNLLIPKIFQQTSEAAGNPTKSSAFSLDCFLIQLTDIDIIYFRMIWAVIMPCIYLIIFFVQYFIGVLTGKIPFKTAMISTAFIYVFLFVQPTLVGGFIQLASTKTISGIPWVQSDLAYRSDNQTHITWVLSFCLPMILLWVFILPFGFLYKIYTYRDVLDNRFIRSRWGFFYNEYVFTAYYWEFIKIFQKELMVIFLTFYEEQVIIKGVLVVLLLFFYNWAQLITKPYSNQILNKADQYSTMVCAITLCLGILANKAQQLQFDYLVYISFAIMIIVNLFFLLFMVFLIFQGYLIKLKEPLDKVRDQINSIFPSLRYQFPSLRRYLKNQGKIDLRVDALWKVLRSYTKQQIKNGTEKLPKYELILNAPYDFKEARLIKRNTATIIPVDEDDINDYLNSDLAHGARGFFKIAQTIGKVIQNEKQQQNESGQDKNESKQQLEAQVDSYQLQKDVQDNQQNSTIKGNFGSLISFLPNSIKTQINNAEQKKNQLGSQFKNSMGLINNFIPNQNQDQNDKKDQEGTFDNITNFLPKAVTSQLNQLEVQQKQLEQQVRDGVDITQKIIPNSNDDQQNQIQDNSKGQGLFSTLTNFMPKAVEQQLKKLEDQKNQLEQQVKQGVDFINNDGLQEQFKDNQNHQVMLSTLNNFMPDAVKSELSRLEDQKNQLQSQTKDGIRSIKDNITNSDALIKLE